MFLLYSSARYDRPRTAPNTVSDMCSFRIRFLGVCACLVFLLSPSAQLFFPNHFPHLLLQSSNDAPRTACSLLYPSIISNLYYLQILRSTLAAPHPWFLVMSLSSRTNASRIIVEKLSSFAFPQDMNPLFPSHVPPFAILWVASSSSVVGRISFLMFASSGTASLRLCSIHVGRR